MIFASQNAREFLLEHGFVITCRKHKRFHVGNDWITDKRGGSKIADVKIFDFLEVNQIPASNWIPSDKLFPFVRWSGFRSIGKWVDEIRKLNKGRFPRTCYLYLVVIR